MSSPREGPPRVRRGATGSPQKQSLQLIDSHNEPALTWQPCLHVSRAREQGCKEEAALRKHGREGLLLRSRACAGLLFAFFYSLLSSRSRPTREGYFPQDWSSLPAGTPSGGRVGLRLELAWLDRAETPC